MAKKPGPPWTHPRTTLASLEAYMSDVNFMRTMVHNAVRFLDDKSLKAESVRGAITSMKEAMERLDKWYEAE